MKKPPPGPADLADRREFFTIDRSPGRQVLDFRRLSLDPIRVLGRYRYTNAHHELATHSHGEMVEICYLESGRQTYTVEGKEFSLTGGDVFLTFPGEQHGTGTHPEARGNLYWLLISVPAARRTFFNLPRQEGKLVLEQLLKLPRRSFRGSSAMPQTLRSIFNYYADFQNPMRIMNLRNLLLRFVLDVISNGTAAQPMTYSPDIVSALNHIKAGVEEPMPLEELAARVNLSLPRLKSKFKAEVGIAPGDYIVRSRVERAAQLLYKSKTSVTDIAMQLGFPSSQYFATVFKRYTCCTPREARNALVTLS